MTETQTTVAVNISVMPEFETRLADALASAAAEVARLEELDQEQRAEMYAIIQAIESDTQAHAKLATGLAQSQTGSRFDA